MQKYRGFLKIYSLLNMFENIILREIVSGRISFSARHRNEVVNDIDVMS